MTTGGGQASRRGRGWIVTAGAVVVAVLLALAGWSVYRIAGVDDANGAVASASASPALRDGVPTALSEAQLKALAAHSGTPVYWAGAKAKTTYEVTRTSDGSIYVRYLPSGTEVGTKSAEYLTVATYLQSGAYTYLSNAQGQQGTTTTSTQSGALVVQYSAYPNSVYFSFPNANFQVEVFSPDSTQPLPLVLHGGIEPVK